MKQPKRKQDMTLTEIVKDMLFMPASILKCDGVLIPVEIAGAKYLATIEIKEVKGGAADGVTM